MSRTIAGLFLIGALLLAAGAPPHGVVEPSHPARAVIAAPSPMPGPDIDPVYVHFDPPDIAGKRRLSLWATHYSIAQAREADDEDGVPLLDMQGRELGPRVRPSDFCRAALEGTVQVTRRRGARRLYDYAGLAEDMQVDCSDLFPRYPALGRARFQRASAPFGQGARGAQMVPFRTIAVDPRVIPLGTLLYIPAARGTEVTLEDGEKQVHDGYFYAADTGGAIDDNHVDVFLGISEKNPFGFVKSRPSATFDAYVVEMPAVRQVFASAHAPVGASKVIRD